MPMIYFIECTNYKTLDSRDRAQELKPQNHNYTCDHKLTRGWYRFTGLGGVKISSSCVSTYRCTSESTGWMSGSHPSEIEGIVTRKVCYNWNNDCCQYNNMIRVRNCGRYYVYELEKPPLCHQRYCTEGGGSL